MKIHLDGSYTTRDGRPVVIYAVDVVQGDDLVIHGSVEGNATEWYAGGLYYHNLECDNDLIQRKVVE